MPNTSLTDALAAIVGPEHVLTGEADRERGSADALSPFRGYRHNAGNLLSNQVDAVVRPASTDEVVAVVQLANERRIPIVPRGGSSGLMGGAVPLRGGIAVDMLRMNRVIDVRPDDLLVEVEAGAHPAEVNKALAEYGLLLGHDPWTVAPSTIGGNIGTNGVGYRAAKYGMAGHQLVAVEAVLPTGTVLTTRATPSPSAGPDLTKLFVGTEGTFGIVTRATLPAYRLPEAQAFATYAFDDFEQGFACMAELVALGIKPALFDLSEEDDRPGAVLYLVFEGYEELVAAEKSRTARIAGKAGGKDLGPKETVEYWRDRHSTGDNWLRNVFPTRPRDRWSSGWGARMFDYVHVAILTSKLLEFRSRAKALLAERGLSVRSSSCWTRPEFFDFGLGFDEAEAPDRASWDRYAARMADAQDAVLMLAQDMGGGMEYVHGVGVKLAHLLAREWGVGLEVVRALKRSLDPNDIMNPGKLGL